MQTCRPKFEVREHFAEAVELISSHQNLKEFLTFTHEHPHHKSPMMKITVRYMSMVLTVLHFIRASRQGRWGLHLASLEAICKYLFAFDKLKYARMVPLRWFHSYM